MWFITYVADVLTYSTRIDTGIWSGSITLMNHAECSYSVSQEDNTW